MGLSSSSLIKLAAQGTAFLLFAEVVDAVASSPGRFVELSAHLPAWVVVSRLLGNPSSAKLLLLIVKLG